MSSSNNTTYAGGSSRWMISQEEQIINFIFLSIVAIATICGNVIALHAFIVSPELKRNTYYFIASLCVSDLMIACLSIPMWLWMVTNNFQPTEPYWIVSFHSCLDIFCGTLSIMSLAMIGVERFVCIKYALRYHQILTTQRVVFIIVALVTYAGVCTIFNYVATTAIDSTKKPKLYIVFQSMIILMAFLIPVSMKIFSYGNIYQEAKKQIAEINKHQNISLGSYSDDTTDTNVSSSTPDLNDNESGMVRMHQKNSSASRVSWTTSPLARRRKDEDCSLPRDSIVTCSPGNDSLKESKSSIFKDTVKGLFQVKCCVPSNQKLIKLTSSSSSIDNLNNNSNADTTVVAMTRTHTQQAYMNRQNTNTSIKSILKKRVFDDDDDDDESSYLMEVSFGEKGEEFDSQTKNSDPSTSPSLSPVSIPDNGNNKKSKKIPRKAASVHEQKQVLVFQGSTESDEDSAGKDRSRAASCPANKMARQSLDVSITNGGAFSQQRPSKSGGGGGAGEERKGSSSPFLRRFRGESKSSVTSSPSLIQKRLKEKQRRHEQKVRRFRKEIRAAKVVGFIMGTFLLCWIPFMVFIALVMFGYTAFEMRFLVIAISLHYMNSAINPILYVMLNKVYRKAVVKGFKRIKRYFDHS